MYVGGGLLGTVLLIMLIVFLVRRVWVVQTAAIAQISWLTWRNRIWTTDLRSQSQSLQISRHMRARPVRPSRSIKPRSLADCRCSEN